LSKTQTTGVAVPSGLHLQSRFFASTAGLWRRIGNFETSVLGDEIRDITIERPVYVTSLARSGTTILTEMLERHPDLTCHRYSDFPNPWTPYWRNYLLRSRGGSVVDALFSGIARPCCEQRAERKKARS
jgi:hypothetical protein